MIRILATLLLIHQETSAQYADWLLTRDGKRPHEYLLTSGLSFLVSVLIEFNKQGRLNEAVTLFSEQDEWQDSIACNMDLGLLLMKMQMNWSLFESYDANQLKVINAFSVAYIQKKMEDPNYLQRIVGSNVFFSLEETKVFSKVRLGQILKRFCDDRTPNLIKTCYWKKFDVVGFKSDDEESAEKETLTVWIDVLSEQLRLTDGAKPDAHASREGAAARFFQTINHDVPSGATNHPHTL